MRGYLEKNLTLISSVILNGDLNMTYMNIII